MKRTDLLRHLTQNGCGLLREGRRHSFWSNPVNGRRSSVPQHTEVGDFLVRKICRDLDIAAPR